MAWIARLASESILRFVLSPERYSGPCSAGQVISRGRVRDGLRCVQPVAGEEDALGAGQVPADGYGPRTSAAPSASARKFNPDGVIPAARTRR